MHEQYPRLELDLSFNDRIADLAENGYDLAIRTGSVEDRAGIIARRVASQRMVVCAVAILSGSTWPARPIADLSRHQTIIYSRTGPVRPWLFPRDSGSPAEFMPVSRLRLDDLDAIADAAIAGMGLAWLPCWLVRERVQAGALVALLPRQPGLYYDCYALWLQTPHLPLKLRVAIDTLAAALPRFMT